MLPKLQRLIDSLPVHVASRSLSAIALLFLVASSAVGLYGLSHLSKLYGGQLNSSDAEVSPFLQPLARSWPAVNAWNDSFEQEYAQFVERLGQAVAARRCRTLDACLRSPESNLLFDPWTDAKIELDVDCGDLPYVLRGYYAFKRRLPFGFVCEVRGNGLDIRYMSEVTPARSCSWAQNGTPRSVLRKMIGQVHSGMYRMAPEVEDADFYPVAINRRAVRPGSVYYDPNGHVMVVALVRPDGAVYLMDGHPDGSLTWKRFGEAFARGGRSQGGGFKNFRPLRLESGALVRAANRELPLFDGQSQWNKLLFQSPTKPGSYHAWVRDSLAEPDAPRDPVADFRDQIRALCRDIVERVEAVDAAIAAGLAARPHPGVLPENIYGTIDDWEVYATPSRDARLKAEFRELHESVKDLPSTSPLLPALRAAWREELAQPSCRFTYKNSAGDAVALTFDAVIDRLFRMSFDPYHCPELRWGAAGTPEFSTCRDDGTKLDFYQRERRLRHRIDREYGVPTPLSAGPEEPPDVDVRKHLELDAPAAASR